MRPLVVTLLARRTARPNRWRTASTACWSTEWWKNLNVSPRS